MNPPESPADPRPNNEPYYIDSECPDCGTELVLVQEDEPEDETWHDEWECPDCEGGIYMDWPDAEWDRLMERVTTDKSEDFTELELGE